MKSNTNIEIDTNPSTDDRSTVNISVPDNTDVTVEVTESVPAQVLRNVETIVNHQDRQLQKITADRVPIYQTSKIAMMTKLMK